MNPRELGYRLDVNPDEAGRLTETDPLVVAELYKPFTAERFFAFLDMNLFKAENFDVLPYLSFVKLHVKYSDALTTSIELLEKSNVNVISALTIIFPVLKTAVLTIVNEMIINDQTAYKNYAKDIYRTHLAGIDLYLQRFPLASND